MPRPTDTFLTDFLAAPSGETQTTVQFNCKNGSVKRYATDILTISGNSFSDDLILADDIEETEDSGTDREVITIDNFDKQIGLDIQNGIINFASVSLGRFFRTKSGSTGWREIFFGEAIPISFNEREAKIEILDDMVAAGYCLANWTLAPNCQLIFKSAYCTHSGSETSCNHLLKGDCTKYGNTAHNVSETFPIIQNSTTPTNPSDGGIQTGGGGGWSDTGGKIYTCFAPDTLILMENHGWKRIADIQPGETVLAFDEFGKIHPAKVKEVFVNEKVEEFHQLDFTFGSLQITGEHPLLDDKFNFRPARYWTKNHNSLFLKKSDWTVNPVRKNILQQNSEKLVFHNLSVEKYQTYIAGGIPVHNLSSVDDFNDLYLS
ncbi:MAG: hypothetical protein K1X72_04245 [Pyrinomonadaceae bacterium]|nr:hypothetical protein [Pyrinomonadaceae bacterium]